jgi:hypothetical protein
MIWNKPHKLKVIALGAINGILLGVLLDIILCLLSYLHHRNWSNYISPWWFFPFWSFVCVTFATFTVHWYFAQYIKSSIWFWQIVGGFTIFSCALYMIFHTFYYLHFVELNFEQYIYLMRAFGEDLFTLLHAYPIIATFNLIFAFVLRRQKISLL